MIEAGIRNLRAVPGRFERVDFGQPFLVIVDYAHTDDALEKSDPHRARAQSQGKNHHRCSVAADRETAPNAPLWAKPPAA